MTTDNQTELADIFTDQNQTIRVVSWIEMCMCLRSFEQRRSAISIYIYAIELP